jgi:hypothetical protein
MRRAFPVAFAALAAVLGVAAALLLFTTFRTYDDEGYVLFSLANFSREGGLYTQVYSQYGPFFFVAADLTHRLFGFEFTNTAGRVITLFHWLGAAVLCGHLVWRQTRSAAWSLFALAATFAQLWQMTSEPMHPGGFITFAVALAAWAGAGFVARAQVRGLALACGLIGAALVLTKINVGALFIAGAGAWLLLHTAGPRLSRVTPWLAGLGLVALPWALMRALWPEEWIVHFALIVGCSALGVLAVTRESRRPWFPLTGWLWCGGGGLLVIALVVGCAALRGTGPYDLLEGVLLAPLRHPGVYSFGVRWRPGASLFAVVSLAICLLTFNRAIRARPWFAPALAGARLTIATVAATSWLGWLPLNPLALVMSYGLSCLWLFVIPLRSDEETHRAVRVRAWLALLAVMQSLHAYPVGGSQIGWGTFLWAPLVALAAAEAVAVLRDKTARLVAPLALAAACGIAFSYARLGWSQWRDSEPLGLPGATAVRLEPAQAAQLRAIAVNASAHCDLLFSLPGMFSFNLWTGLPAPTSANVTHWFNLLSAAQQAAIIAQLEAHPRAGIVVERDVLALILHAGIPVGGPLRDYLYQNFTAAFAAGSQEFWVRRNRSVAPLGTARILYRVADGTGERTRLEFIAASTGQRVARIEWFEGPQLRATFTSANARAELEPLRIDGTSTASPAPGWDRPLPPIARLVLFTDDPGASSPPQRGALFRLRDAQGNLIADLILRD